MLCNLFKGGLTFATRQEYVLTTCLRLFGANLQEILAHRNNGFNTGSKAEQEEKMAKIYQACLESIKTVVEITKRCDNSAETRNLICSQLIELVPLHDLIMPSLSMNYEHAYAAVGALGEIFGWPEELTS